MELNKVYNMDCLTGLKQLDDNSVDLIATDPPYGLKFMGKDWDKALPDINVFKECYRVLKPGSWCLVMSAPRSDLQARMSLLLEDAGFNIGYTPIYWTFASGFPKAGNLGKMADKRLGKEREVIGQYKRPDGTDRNYGEWNKSNSELNFRSDKPEPELRNITTPSSDEAKSLDGSYAGFQPKPAVEVVLVAMKPLSERTYIDQALRSLEDENVGLGGSWLDDARIPHSEPQKTTRRKPREAQVFTDKNCGFKSENLTNASASPDGRFPANLLVSDDILNDGIERKSGNWIKNSQKNKGTYNLGLKDEYDRSYHNGDSGSFSRYFDLDIWFDNLPESVQKTYPFLLVPKASKSEKNKGCEELPYKMRSENNKMMGDAQTMKTGSGNDRTIKFKNNHPTVKPLKLFTYLITLFSRPNQTVLDPYTGSGTTCIAAKLLNRNYIGFELETEYKTIADARLTAHKPEIEKEIPLTAF